jgi:hypothetical protein
MSGGLVVRLMTQRNVESVELVRTVARPRKLRPTRALSSCPACSVILHIAPLSSTLVKYPLDSPRHLVARSDHRRELSGKLLYACCRRLSVPPRLRCTDHEYIFQAPDSSTSPGCPRVRKAKLRSSDDVCAPPGEPRRLRFRFANRYTQLIPQAAAHRKLTSEFCFVWQRV